MASRPTFAALTADLVKRDHRTVVAARVKIKGPDGPMSALVYLDAQDVLRCQPHMDREEPQ